MSAWRDLATLRDPDRFEAWHSCSESQAIAFIGDWAHVFAVWRPSNGPLLKAFLSTVRVRPATAVPSPSASPG